jgi:hypothetical protein
MYSERDIEKIRENIYWENRLRELMNKDDCSDSLREECMQDIEKLNVDSNMIEYGTPYKPKN